MQLNITTDYAIRILVYLGENKQVISSVELSQQMAIPQSYVIKVMKRFIDLGIVSTRLGKTGGYQLIATPEDITLLKVLESIEPTMKINRCLEEDAYCNRNACEICKVRNTHLKIQNVLEKELRNVTLKDLLNNE